MPELPTLTITAPNGSERATLSGIRAEHTRHVTDRSRARFVLDAASWQTVADSINRRADRFRIDAAGETGWFGGRFRDTERGGQQVTVILDDYERDARDAQPTGGQVLFQNVDDATVVQDAIGRVPTLSAGTIQTVASGLSFSFSNAEPAKMIRDAAQPGGALVRYNADRTVDFVARPASGSGPELSTAANTLVGEPDVSDDNRNPPTDVIGLGAQSGPNQVRATATVDPTAARDVYRRYENKDIQQQDRLQTTVDRLADEVAAAEDKLDVEAGAINLDVRPGDPLAFVWPARGIDETVRVIEFTEVINERGQRYAPLRVSNRWPEQGGSDKAAKDLERFNRGYQGFIDRDNFRAVERQPVGSSLAATGEYPYPDDVVTEVTSEITVRSLPYRSYVSSGGHSHNFTLNDHTHDVTISDSVTSEVQNILTSTQTSTGPTGQNITLNSGDQSLISQFDLDGDDATIAFFEFIITVEDAPSATGGITLEARVQENDGDVLGQTFWDPVVFSTNTDELVGSVFDLTLPFVNVDGSETLETIVDLRDSPGEFEFFANTRLTVFGDHDHGVTVNDTTTTAGGGGTSSTTDSETALEPGVVESFPEAPGANQDDELLASGVDIVIDGTTVASNIGSGEFVETVDISGDLSPGVNDIKITSDELGLMSAYVQTELFRQGPEDTT